MKALILGPPSDQRALVEACIDRLGYIVGFLDEIPDADALGARLLADPPSLLVMTQPRKATIDLCRVVQPMIDEALTAAVVVPDSTREIEPEVLALAEHGCLIASTEPRLLEAQLRAAAHVRHNRRSAYQAELHRARAAAAALAESEARTRSVLETTVDGIITINETGRIESFNTAAERIFGYRAEDVIGENVSLLMPAPYREEHDAYIDRYLSSGTPRIIGIGREVTGLRADGTTFPLDLSVSEVNLADRRIFTGIVRDISRRRALEQEILRISDQERRRIGQDMHDGLGQMLSGIGLISRNLARRMREAGSAFADEQEEIADLVRDADQYARSLSRNLVPVELEQGGLLVALDRLAHNAERLFDIRCTFEATGSPPEEQGAWAIHLYRIAQEAVSNAVKHGKAERVRMTLALGPERIRLIVQDDGAGFPDTWSDSPGMGVRLMAYRANLIGAVLDIRDGVDGGTVVRCTLRPDALASAISVSSTEHPPLIQPQRI